MPKSTSKSKKPAGAKVKVTDLKPKKNVKGGAIDGYLFFKPKG
jgi:hypothetical protein